jgi:hypothetical protein
MRLHLWHPLHVVSHFLEAPKLALFFVVCASPSLSSTSLSLSLSFSLSLSLSLSFFLFLVPPLLPLADVGVGCAEPVSRNDVDSGVGACDAGVEPIEPGVVESCIPILAIFVCEGQRRGKKRTHAVVWSVRNRGFREHAVLVHGSRLPPLRRRASHSLHVVVKSRNDVSTRCTLKICQFFLMDSILDLDLKSKAAINQQLGTNHPTQDAQRSINQGSNPRALSSRDLPAFSPALCASRPARARALAISCIQPPWVAVRWLPRHRRCPACSPPCTRSSFSRGAGCENDVASYWA